MTTLTATNITDLAPGRWTIDPAHSEVSFAIRHLMVSKVRGSFTSFSGAFDVAPDPAETRLEATIDTASVDTRHPDRDAHLRSGDFLDAERHPVMRFRATGTRSHGDGAHVSGELTVRGVSRPVDLAVEVHGVTHAMGDTRAGFSATAQLDRSAFGVGPSHPLEGGGVALGDRVDVDIQVQAVLAEPS